MGLCIEIHLQKTPYVFPIVGGRKVEQLHANIKALDIKLTPEQIKALEEVIPFDQGFPNSMIVSRYASLPILSDLYCHSRAMVRMTLGW